MGLAEIEKPANIFGTNDVAAPECGPLVLTWNDLGDVVSQRHPHSLFHRYGLKHSYLSSPTRLLISPQSRPCQLKERKISSMRQRGMSSTLLYLDHLPDLLGPHIDVLARQRCL